MGWLDFIVCVWLCVHWTNVLFAHTMGYVCLEPNQAFGDGDPTSYTHSVSRLLSVLFIDFGPRVTGDMMIVKGFNHSPVGGNCEVKLSLMPTAQIHFSYFLFS